MPAFSAALSYYDSYRSERLPANLLQAQRDYFGAHTYERVDKPSGESFHTEWLGGAINTCFCPSPPIQKDCLKFQKTPIDAAST